MYLFTCFVNSAASYQEFGRISGAARRKPGFSGLRYRSGPGAQRRGCFAPLQSLARRLCGAYEPVGSNPQFKITTKNTNFYFDALKLIPEFFLLFVRFVWFVVFFVATATYRPVGTVP
ncbi:hypothetical protein LQZ21_09555 [Treponema sp. TIM-1]|uniref:hypothetical protein n=1 Tax=Treponema sp. TIM-1 TaxID=2898417 RepID=UPI00398101EF